MADITESRELYFKDTVLPAFKRQLHLGLATASSLGAFIKVVQGLSKMLFEDEFPSRPDFEVLHSVGSVAEGILPPPGLRSSNTDFDIDLMFILAIFDAKSFSEFVQPVEDGYYKIQEVHKLPPSNQLVKQSALLCAKTLKSYFTSVGPSGYNFAGSEGVTVTNFFQLGENGDQFPAFSAFNSHQVHGPALSMNFINSKAQPDAKKGCDMDMVFAYQVDYWPPTVQGWLSRKRHWPPKDVVEAAMKQGCQLVCKPRKCSRATVEEDEEEEGKWQVTFTLAEKVVNQARLEHQKLLHLLAKSIYYSHLHLEEEGHEFSSYAIKTCAMWLQEETPVENWTDDTMLSLLQQLFQNLFQAVTEGKLPHYFNPQFNIFRDYPQGLLKMAGHKLSAIVQDLPSFVNVDVLGTTKDLAEEDFQKTVGYTKNIPLQVIPQSFPKSYSNETWMPKSNQNK